MSAKNIYDALRDYRQSRETLPANEPATLNQSTTGTFNIRNLVKNVEPHKGIYNALSSNADTLSRGYRIAVSLYQDTLISKRNRLGYFEKKYKLDEKVDVYVIKSIGENVDLKPDIITPNRFSMILSMAADKIYNHAMGEGDMVVLGQLSNIINPFGMMHGFYPGALEVGVPRTSPKVRLLYYYLVTTIGFDAIAHVSPLRACAIAAFRLLDDNPEKLGLMKDLPPDATVENNAELASRCIQGVYTKEFKFQGVKYKIQDALEDAKFYDEVRKEVKFLTKYASEPTRARNVRILSVASTLVKILDDDESDDDGMDQSDDEEYRKAKEERDEKERKLREEGYYERSGESTKVTLEDFEEAAKQSTASPEKTQGAHGTPKSQQRTGGAQGGPAGHSTGAKQKTRGAGKGKELSAANAALMKRGSDTD